ncbi:hypothetical protein ACLOJK_004141 [Asimina triloba]
MPVGGQTRIEEVKEKGISVSAEERKPIIDEKYIGTVEPGRGGVLTAKAAVQNRMRSTTRGFSDSCRRTGPGIEEAGCEAPTRLTLIN